MSAKDQIAQMLNELMGPNRNEEINRSMLNFRDEDVCKYYLAGFCPHDEFVNTKADLGPCRNMHDDNLRIAYRSSSSFGKIGYERQFFYYLQSIYDDVQRKIDRNKERLTLTQGTIDETTKNQLTERAKQMEREIANYIIQAEEAGASGQIELSQKHVKTAEDLKVELDSVKRTIDNPQRLVNDPNAPKPMRVCDVCGCFLIIGDVQQRIEDHLNGKQHLGYAKIAATIEELREKLKRELSPIDNRRRRSRSPRRNRSDRENHRDKKRSRSKDKDRRRRHSRSRSPKGEKKSGRKDRH